MRNLTINCEGALLRANNYKEFTVHLEDVDNSDLNINDVYEIIHLEDFIEYHGVYNILDNLDREEILQYLFKIEK